MHPNNDTSCRRQGGSPLERLIFNHRLPVVLLCLLLTLLMGYFALGLRVNASFDEMIPKQHPYIQNYFETRSQIGGLGNTVTVVVENLQGEIFDEDFIEVTRRINDDIFVMPGVDRAWMKSIWMSSVRWTEVTEEGFRGGPVMPSPYDAETLRRNVRVSGIVGSLVGNNYRSILIVVPLLEKDAETGLPLDYGAFARQLEQQIRDRYSEEGRVAIHITGFAKLVGDLIDGIHQILGYFLAAAAIAGLMLFWFTRCLRSTLLVLLASTTAVLWLMGLVRVLGFDLNPFSVLVPFLVFAIGVSHGAQIMNAVLDQAADGQDAFWSARLAFRRLLAPGMAAIVSDAIGMIVLMVVDIPVIRNLALITSLGIAILIATNLVLLSLLFSFVGVGHSAAERRRRLRQSPPPLLWRGLSGLTDRRRAVPVLVVAAGLLVVGLFLRTDLRIGDLDQGAPELHEHSRYNQDVFFTNANYNLTSDLFVVMVRVPDDQCADYQVLRRVDELAYMLRGIPGVQSTDALPGRVAALVAGLQEGHPKWFSLPQNPSILGAAAQSIITDQPQMVDNACSLIPVYVYLKDHRADTLSAVMGAVESFAQEYGRDDLEFLLASGPSGIEAVTNVVVEEANGRMLLLVYGAVILACLVCFRSWRAVLVAILPLMLVSILAEGLMATLDIGIKVATLPVVALGVGIGVDYALYLLTEQLSCLRQGLSLAESYRRALASVGRIVALVGLTLAAGVITWAWSPIKFQVDMGVMLTFMFLCNMVGALVLIPALSCFLLKPSGAAAQQPSP